MSIADIKNILREVGFTDTKQFAGEYLLMINNNDLRKVRVYDNGSVWVADSVSGEYNKIVHNPNGVNMNKITTKLEADLTNDLLEAKELIRRLLNWCEAAYTNISLTDVVNNFETLEDARKWLKSNK